MNKELLPATDIHEFDLTYTTFLPAPCLFSNPSSINRFRSVTACFTLRPAKRAYCARLMQGFCCKNSLSIRNRCSTESNGVDD